MTTAHSKTQNATVLFRTDASPTLPTQSKVGGAPYFPIGFAHNAPKRSPWPKDAENDRELQLLIQINFAEMPVLPPFPRSGILQLFVDDGSWHELGESLRTYYHSEVADDPYDFSEVSTAHFRVPESALHFESRRRLWTVSEGNKIGGRHYSQNGRDPRVGLEGWGDSLLLVQFDDSGVLSWGDCGSAQFFIKRADLLARDFSSLLFFWDST